MNKLAILPLFFLTMCGTAPITDDAAHAFELEVEESHWDHVYRACLLYTSPSPRDQRGSRMPSSA